MRRSVAIFHVHPRALVTDVDELEKVAVESCFLARRLEKRSVGPWGAGSHHDPAEVVLGDGPPDLGQPSVRAGKQTVLGYNHIGERLGGLDQRRNVQVTSDIMSTVTDEYPNPERPLVLRQRMAPAFLLQVVYCARKHSFQFLLQPNLVLGAKLL